MSPPAKPASYPPHAKREAAAARASRAPARSAAQSVLPRARRSARMTPDIVPSDQKLAVAKTRHRNSNNPMNLLLPLHNPHASFPVVDRKEASFQTGVKRLHRCDSRADRVLRKRVSYGDWKVEICPQRVPQSPYMPRPPQPPAAPLKRLYRKRRTLRYVRLSARGVSDRGLTFRSRYRKEVQNAASGSRTSELPATHESAKTSLPPGDGYLLFSCRRKLSHSEFALIPEALLNL